MLISVFEEQKNIRERMNRGKRTRAQATFSIFSMYSSCYFLLVVLTVVYVAEVASLSAPQTQLGKVKRKLRGIANSLKQDVDEPLVCIQCGKGAMEEITPSFLLNLGAWILHHFSHHFLSVTHISCYREYISCK